MLHIFGKIPRSLVVGFLGGCLSSGLWNFVIFHKLLARKSQSDSCPKKSVKEQRPRIVLFGDSLTQQGFDSEKNGWAAQLAHWYERRCDIVNRGFSGYNSRWNFLMMSNIFPETDSAPLLVIIFLGANDATFPETPQYVPINEYATNLREIILYLRRVYPKTLLIMITPPPLHLKSWNDFMASSGRSPNRDIALTQAYADRCVAVGNGLGVPVLNIHAGMGGSDQEGCLPFLSDGLHLTAKGNDLLFVLLQKLILAQLPQLNPESIKMQAPYWADIDSKNPNRLLENFET